MKTEEEMLNIPPERLAQMRRYEARNRKEEEREASKPEWLKDKEKAESLGRFVLWLFTDLYGLVFLAFVVLVIYKTLTGE